MLVECHGRGAALGQTCLATMASTCCAAAHAQGQAGSGPARRVSMDVLCWKCSSYGAATWRYDLYREAFRDLDVGRMMDDSGGFGMDVLEIRGLL